MSSVTLTDDEYLALGKGLKFIPTPRHAKHNDIILDWHNFRQRMRAKALFHNKPRKIKPFTERTGKTINPTIFNGLEDFLYQVRIDFDRFMSQNKLRRHTPNMSLNVVKALKELKANSNIMIKKADKGTSTVILDRQAYIEGGENHLKSPLHYQKVQNCNTVNTAQLVSNTLHTMLLKGDIDRSTFKYLNPVLNKQEIKTPSMYFLPKIHKNPVAFRPICASNNSPTERISSYLDYFLQPIAKSQSTYVRDTTDFINKIESLVIPTDCFLASADITGMYTNLNHKEVYTEIQHALIQNSNLK